MLCWCVENGYVEHDDSSVFAMDNEVLITISSGEQLKVNKGMKLVIRDNGVDFFVPLINNETTKQRRDQNMNKAFLAFVGQNATCGTPHPTTGRMSTHGYLIAFSKRSDRDQFCKQFGCDTQRFVRTCNKETARRFYLGTSISTYNDILDQAISEMDCAL